MLCHKDMQASRFYCRLIFVSLFSTVNQDGFKPNFETHLLPLLSMKLKDTSSESKEKTAAFSSKASHHPLLMQVHIVFPSFELSLNMKFSSKVSPLNNLSCSWIQTGCA